MTYTAEATWHTHQTLTDDLIFDFAALGGAAAATPGDHTVHATFTVDGATLVDAMDDAVVRLAAIADGEPVAIEILTHTEADRRNAEPRFPPLAGIAEVAQILGINKQRASQLQTRTGFPPPVAVLRSGPVWRARDIEAFGVGWERRPGRPRKTVLAAS